MKLPCIDCICIPICKSFPRSDCAKELVAHELAHHIAGNLCRKCKLLRKFIYVKNYILSNNFHETIVYYTRIHHQ